MVRYKEIVKVINIPIMLFLNLKLFIKFQNQSTCLAAKEKNLLSEVQVEIMFSDFDINFLRER